MREFASKHTKLIIIVVVIIFLAFLVRTVNQVKAEREFEEQQQQALQAEQEEVEEPETEEELLMSRQPELEAAYGRVPDGFIWDEDGRLLSIGDRSMSSEDVVYAYFRGLSSLDMGTVERYSRYSSVVQTYSGYFDSENKEYDYLDQFTRNMYKQCLLSIQVEGIQDQAVFAENKQVFTVNAKMLDLTDKDFWKKDSKEIYERLYLYDSDESDSTKGEIYLYDYILNYYMSDSAKLRDVSFNVTLERYPDLNSGWLVSIDTDVDDACLYKDGNLVVSYIQDVFRNDILEDMKESRGN